MANFKPAFERMILNEGGYVLHKVKNDRGGTTYAGIAQNFHPNWEGWKILERDGQDSPDLTRLVQVFYKINYWDKVKGDDIKSETIAGTVFDFAVNAGVRTAAKLAQIVAGCAPDGVVGSKTVAALNEIGVKDLDMFTAQYALAKITRYAGICNRDRSQSKFLLGWINRTIKDLKQ